MQLAEQKTERLEARITPDTKVLFQKAAKIQGRTLSEFVIDSAVEVARRTVKENDFLEMTYQDRIAFAEALLKEPASPNAKLQKAVRRHARIFGR